jgi:hypothetical protein
MERSPKGVYARKTSADSLQIQHGAKQLVLLLYRVKGQFQATLERRWVRERDHFRRPQTRGILRAAQVPKRA